MEQTALITGASGGIGWELARIHASRGGNLVLVARNKTKLDERKADLEKQYGVRVHSIAKDLSRPGASNEIYEEVKSLDIRVGYLINNAGFGDFGMFVESDWRKTEEMINLNIAALTHLTRLFLPEMLNARSGKIMNVASTASFQPGPTMAVYFATKAYVLSFSEALGNEVREHGVTVTALCPGPTESGFQGAAAMEESGLVKGKKLPAPEEVARYGYAAMIKGQTVAIHGFLNALMAFSVRFAPRSLTIRISRWILDKK
jgi:short-subunit dehydrogenase